MKVSYQMDQEVLTAGMKQHFKHKGRTTFFIWIVIGIFLLYFGINLMMSHEDKGLGIFCCLFACVFFFQQKVAIWKNIRSSFRNKPPTSSIVMEVSQKGMRVKSAEANGLAEWNQFTEVITTPNGILLYTQKNNFNWIPQSQVEGGTWQDFSEFIEQHITLAKGKA